jgi:cysteine desulfurase
LLIAQISNFHRNGNLEHRSPGNSSLTFPRVDAEALIANVPKFSLSAGSAYTSGTLAPAHVLRLLVIVKKSAANGTGWFGEINNQRGYFENQPVGYSG